MKRTLLPGRHPPVFPQVKSPWDLIDTTLFGTWSKGKGGEGGVKLVDPLARCGRKSKLGVMKTHSIFRLKMSQGTGLSGERIFPQFRICLS